jgi:hypothetical protein
MAEKDGLDRATGAIVLGAVRLIAAYFGKFGGPTGFSRRCWKDAYQFALRDLDIE